MGWNLERAQERARKTYEDVGEVTVTPIVRETEFDNIALRNPRLVNAAHCYVDISTFRSVVGVGAADEECVWALNTYSREVARIVEDFDGEKVHMQGPRLHALVYRPISDASAKAIRATLMVAAVCETARRLAAVLGLTSTWKPAAGIDIGDALATKDGSAGDRELLFLGSAANVAAKVISTGIVLTQRVADLLPTDISDHLAEAGDHWRLSLTSSQLESLVQAYGYAWTATLSEERLAAEAEMCPISVVKLLSPVKDVDKDTLRLSNSRLVEGISLFADVDGFTAFIEAEELKGTLPEAVRSYHCLRTEMRNVLRSDYGQLRVQYQGDRMQGLVYVPIGDADKVAATAVEVAAALTSTVTDVLPAVIGAASKPLAIGLAYGPVVLTKLGERGNRDVVTLGEATAEAARIQQSLAGGSTGINGALRDLLPEWMQALFPWNASARAHVAENLRVGEVVRLAASAQGVPIAKLAEVAAVAGLAALAAAALTRRAADAAKSSPQVRPWCND